jgi:hypothetical protein
VLQSFFVTLPAAPAVEVLLRSFPLALRAENLKDKMLAI